MIGKRQHSSPIPENLACEISVATSQVRVSGNRRRGRLYNQPARHCPFFFLSFFFLITLTALILSSSRPFLSFCPCFLIYKRIISKFFSFFFYAILRSLLCLISCKLLFQSRADLSNEMEETAKVSLYRLLL